MAPVITTPPVSQQNRTLNNVTFACTVIGNPRPMIQWKLNENMLNNRSDSDGIKILIIQTTMGNCVILDPPSHCETSSTLTIFNVQFSDSGEYTCNANNNAGTVTRSATLNVIGMILLHNLFFNTTVVLLYSYLKFKYFVPKVSEQV